MSHVKDDCDISISKDRASADAGVFDMELLQIWRKWFYNNLMLRIREALDNGTFDAFYRRYVNLLDTRI